MSAFVEEPLFEECPVPVREVTVNQDRAIAASEAFVARMNPKRIDLSSATAWQLPQDPGEESCLGRSCIL